MGGFSYLGYVGRMLFCVCHDTRLLDAASQSGAGHALAQAALFQKILFQPAQLLVEQIIGLVNSPCLCIHNWLPANHS